MANVMEIDHMSYYKINGYDVYSGDTSFLVCKDGKETIYDGITLEEVTEKLSTNMFINIEPEVMDLLIGLTKTAALSNRHDLILKPKPPNFTIETLRDTILNMPSLNIVMKNQNDKDFLKSDFQRLLEWIVKSCLQPIRHLKDSYFPSMNAICQYSIKPSKEFSDLKGKYGTIYAFHGSVIENWHSILRNGLKVASGTNLQLNGSAYGKGVYCSKSLQLSFNDYSKIPQNNQIVNTNKIGKSKILNFGLFHLIGLCEIINYNLNINCDVVVIPEERLVRVAFIFAYSFLGIKTLPNLHTEKSPLYGEIFNLIKLN